MPELPEVETIRRGLQKHLIGLTIRDVEIRMAKQFRGDPKRAIGGKIMAARRFGKGLVIDLDNDYSLAIHVKMTGQLVFSHLPLVIGKYTHGIFKLSNNKNVGRDDNTFAYLLYNDMRQFGWVHVLPTVEVLQLPFFQSLGREPLKDLTLQKFVTLLKGTKTPIKLLLMDQRKIAGIGNIYANDALYLAKLHPQRPSSSLLDKEVKELFAAIENVLQKGIAVGGASERDYVNVLGGKGEYQNFFLVYRKNGTACQRCGTIIQKIKLGGRGTFFCPSCQQAK